MHYYVPPVSIGPFPEPPEAAPILNPINLTDENKSDLRAFVNELMKDQPKIESLPTSHEPIDLSAIVRRSWAPKLAVQIYNSSPLIAALLANTPKVP